MKNNNYWRYLKKELLNKYPSLEDAFIDLIPGWIPPKCKLCNNKLPEIGSLYYDDNKNLLHKPDKRFCCLSPECRSSKINIRSDEYKNIVMGRSIEEIIAKNKERVRKVIETSRKRGVYLPENNPMSKNKLRQRGMSEEEITKFSSDRALKSIETKRKAGWYDDISNNVYSKEYHLKKGLSQKEADHFIRSKNHNCKEFWIKQGYSEEDSIKNSKKSADTISLNSKINRYGEELGKIKYKETIKNISAGWNINSAGHFSFGTSKAASDIFDEIKKNIPFECYYKSKINSEINNKEWYISVLKNIYFYDFVIVDLKIIIEFNGEHVHPRKDLLTEEQFINWKHAFSKESGIETYNKDQNKIYTAEKEGYNVLVLWSKDSKDFNINKALNFIKEHTNGKIKSFG